MKLGDLFHENFCLSPDVYLNFMQLFQDRNPLHTNKEFAIASGFEDYVMHGNILNGFLSYFIGECLPIKKVIIHSQEIYFKNPVYLNEKLQFKAVIVGVYESVAAVEFKYDFKNTDEKIVAKGKIQIGLLK